MTIREVLEDLVGKHDEMLANIHQWNKDISQALAEIEGLMEENSIIKSSLADYELKVRNLSDLLEQHRQQYADKCLDVIAQSQALAEIEGIIPERIEEASSDWVSYAQGWNACVAMLKERVK